MNGTIPLRMRLISPSHTHTGTGCAWASGSGLGEQQASEETGVTVDLARLAVAFYLAEPLGLLCVSEHVEGHFPLRQGRCATPRRTAR